MKDAKRKIEACVAAYKRYNPREYRMVVRAIEAKRSMNANEYASIQGAQSDMRGLFEIPQVLHKMIVDNLTLEELSWFKTGQKGKPNEGGRWFAKTFREFALPSEI